MGKKVSMPAAPDPVVTSQTQMAMNADAARISGRMTNPNVYTPYGSQEVTWNGPTYNTPTLLGAEGTTNKVGYGNEMFYIPQALGEITPDRYASGEVRGMNGVKVYQGTSDQPTVTQRLSPEQQSLLNSQNRIYQNLANVGEAGLSRVGQAMSTPFDTSNLPAWASSINPSNYQTGYASGGDIQRNVSSGPLAYDYASGGNIQRDIQRGPLAYDYASGGNIQKGLDYSGVSRLPTLDDFGADRDRVEQAILSRLQPQMERQRNAEYQRLRNQGLTANHEAYQNDMRMLGQQENDARMQTILAGAQEQNRLFNQAMDARRQGVSEVNTQGSFANQAQAQAEAQAAARANFLNQARGQEFGQDLQAGQFANQAQSQAEQQAAARAAFMNQARGQEFGQNLQAGQFANQAQSQAEQQAAARAAFANDVEGRRFQEGTTNANFQNQARQQQIAEQAYLRSLPLNELTALMSGGQVNMPQFQGYQGQGVQAPNYQQAVMNNYQGGLNAASMQNASNNAMMSGLFGLGTAGIGAYGLMNTPRPAYLPPIS